MKKSEFHKAFRELRAYVLKQQDFEFFGLCKEYLGKYHQLKQLDFKLAQEKRVINVFICKRPPCK